MRHFSHLTGNERHHIFHVSPATVSRFSAKEEIAVSLGAVLYMPADRPTFARELISKKNESLSSVVLDLEDALADHKTLSAESNILLQLKEIEQALLEQDSLVDYLPFIFVRVRDHEQLQRMMALLGNLVELVTGFIFPKFEAVTGVLYMSQIHEYNQLKRAEAPILFAIPVLETQRIIYKETRWEELLAIHRLLDQYKPYVLNIRIGTTDLSGMLGLRRSAQATIYDIFSVRDCIIDIVNIFGRYGSEYVISGSVFEYFHANSYEAFKRELELDKENGLIGKTVIHPSQVLSVQSNYIVTHEEYVDALTILNCDHTSNGVIKSNYGNKMNEIKPHQLWAKKILVRADIYGVLHEKQTIQSLYQRSKQHYI